MAVSWNPRVVTAPVSIVLIADIGWTCRGAIVARTSSRHAALVSHSASGGCARTLRRPLASCTSVPETRPVRCTGRSRMFCDEERE
jgi:hypothetical protein